MPEYERHADPLDEANVLTERLTSNAIASASQACAPETHPDFDGESCVDCGETIPAKRLAMFKVRCVRCQSILEHQRKQFASPTVITGIA